MLRCARTTGMTGRAAASRGAVERRLWAVLAWAAQLAWRTCCDRSNGGPEPIMTDAARCMDDGFGEHNLDHISET